MKKVRAKFSVQSITEHADKTKTVQLVPVMSGSEENKKFWEYTPNGRIELNITNPEVNFEFGDYYIDFEKAE